MAEQTPEPDDNSGPQATNLRPALSRCVTVGSEQFAAEYWGRTPLLSHTPGFGDLFGPESVDELLTVRGLRTPFLRMARNGEVLAAAAFTGGGGVGAQVTDQADAAKIFTQMSNGATLVLQGLHRTWPRLQDFTRQLQDDLGHPVQTNAYVTPATAQGFETHYDTHDVFVLQIAGAKTWQLHRPVLENPLPDQPWERHRSAVADRSREAPHLTVTLAPGDCLYVPRGWLHSAMAHDDVSIHLTMGVHNLTGEHVIRSLIRAALAQPDDDGAALRRSLPLGGTQPPQLLAQIDRMRKELVETLAGVDAHTVADDVLSEYDRSTRPDPVGPLRQLRATDSVGPGSSVRLRGGVRTRLSRHGDRVRLTGGGRYVEAPATCERALALIAAGGALTPSDLPGIDTRTGVALVRRALRETIVVPLER